MTESEGKRKLRLIGQLARSDDRQALAKQLAPLYNAQDLLLFHKDPLIGAFLPAPGFIQTLKDGKKWQALLCHCAAHGHVHGKASIDSGDEDLSVVGVCVDDIILMLLGREPAIEQDDDLLLLLPLLSEAFACEKRALESSAIAALAKEKAEGAAMLAESLENARSQLANALLEARSAHTALREADARKDEFLAILAHELRNPLAPIGNGLEVLKYLDKNPEKLEEVRSMMERQLRHMVRLIDDLMDVSRITRGKITLRKECVPFSKVASMAVDETQELIRKNEHDFRMEIPQHPIFLKGDPSRFVQIFSNLLSNAAKYTPSKGSITLSAEEHSNHIEVSITDTGMGMTPDQIRVAFDMFAQAEHGEGKSGLGVGLALVKSLVELHGGSITASSDGLGKGSVFKVWLPIQSGKSETAPAVALEKRSATQKKFRILIVDDNVESAKTMALAMEVVGHDTKCAFDGKSALRLAPIYQPQIVLLDIGLPDISGYEVCKRLKESDYAKNSIFIAQTGWGQDADKTRAKEAGFQHHLIKPVEIEHLRKIVNESFS